MTKVTMLADTGRKVDLFPDNTRLREVLEHFQESSIGTANAEPVLEEDLDKPLYAFARDAEVTLTTFPRPEEGGETAWIPEGKTRDEIREMLLKAKEEVETALKALEEEGEMPF